MLAGSVTVRDLWEKKDLGKFSERFTAQVSTAACGRSFSLGCVFTSNGGGCRMCRRMDR